MRGDRKGGTLLFSRGAEQHPAARASNMPACLLATCSPVCITTDHLIRNLPRDERADGKRGARGLLVVLQLWKRWKAFPSLPSRPLVSH